MLNLDELVDFPQETILKMQDIIAEKKQAPELKRLFVNTILREDIFDILESCCTVVYFPLSDEEENDGFQVARAVDYGKQGAHEEMFVFLNTAKPLEKQVFTAGHELGHIWGVADSIWNSELGSQIPRSMANEEAAMNRFSAELLMPTEQFKQSANAQLESYRVDGKIKIINGIRVIASLMNEFCVPANAVGRRLYETKCLPKQSCEKLMFTGPGRVSSGEYQRIFQDALRDCIEEGGYTRLNKPTKKYGIKEFPSILSKVEEKHIFSQERIKNLRSQLHIPVIDEKEDGLGSGDL